MEVYLSAEDAREYIQQLTATLKESMRQTDEAITIAKQRTTERDEARGCDGNCACVVFASRHEAAMAGFKVQSECDRLRALLREVEWIRVLDTAGDWYWTCPACLVDRDARGGHVVGCRLLAALEGRDG